MTDRELLEAAARAAGMPVGWYSNCMVHLDADGRYAGWWIPFTDDGDALRLAVKVKLRVNILSDRTEIVFWPPAGADSLFELHGDNPFAATRRAIVQAAAEMASS